jgi:hypothetical protein
MGSADCSRDEPTAVASAFAISSAAVDVSKGGGGTADQVLTPVAWPMQMPNRKAERDADADNKE